MRFWFVLAAMTGSRSRRFPVVRSRGGLVPLLPHSNVWSVFTHAGQACWACGFRPQDGPSSTSRRLSSLIRAGRSVFFFRNGPHLPCEFRHRAGVVGERCIVPVKQTLHRGAEAVYSRFRC